MNKRTVVLAGAGALLVTTILVSYFFVVPSVQLGAYKNTVGTKQSELKSTLSKLGALLERDSFVKAQVEVGTIRSDVKVGNEAIKDVEAKLELVKKDLTDFNELPLLGFNEKYKTAVSLKSDAQQYVTKTEAFVAEMKAVLVYFDKNADLMSKFTDFTNAATAAGEAESVDVYADIVEKSIKDLQPAVDAFAHLTPPASLKDGHEYGVKAIGEFIELYRQSATLVKAGDMAALTALDEKITTKAAEIAKKSDEYSTQFIRESPLRKLDDALKQLDRDISRKQASL